jgi:hypothetical protein
LIIFVTPRYTPLRVMANEEGLPECADHRALLIVLKAELALVLEYMRHEKEISGLGTENTLAALRKETNSHIYCEHSA